MTPERTVRIDSWIWSVRLLKTRSTATAACRAGHVSLNGSRVKAAQRVSLGDEIRIRYGREERIVQVSQLAAKRISAAEAMKCFVDLTPVVAAVDSLVAAVPLRERGAGRPTKRERRELHRLRGY